MGKNICLDAGIITLHYTRDDLSRISTLMMQIQQKKIIASTIAPILVESYNHLCKANGVIQTEETLASFLNQYPIDIVPISTDLIFKAGQLKCQYRSILSYNDCLIIALSLNQKLILHTTEKNLPKIPNLKIKAFTF